MKPLSLNLSQMKKISGDDKSSTFQHPSGHKMVIVHAAVSPLHRKQLEALPVHVEKMADGGQSGAVDDPHANAMSTSDQPSGTDAPKIPDTSMEQPSTPAAGETLPANPEVPITESPVRAPAADSTQMLPTASPNFEQAFNQGQKAISEQAQVDTAKAKANADIQSQDLLNRQSLNDEVKTNIDTFTKHQQDLIKDYAAGHIDPKHYVENMGAGEKVATGIGLLLGGFSTPFTGQSNPAMDFLNKQIDRDIQGQHDRMEQQKTLLGANQELFRDQQLAQNQTRINMNDIYDHKIQLAASQLGTQQAKAAADMAHANFTMQNAALLQQNAIRTAVMNRVQGSGGAGLNAIDLANAGLIPKEAADKEQASIDAQRTAIAKTSELFDALNKEQTPMNLFNPQSYQRVAALKAELVNGVMNASASKRLTKESVEAEINPLMVKTLSNKGTAEAFKQGMLNIIQRHADPTPYMSHYAPSSIPSYNQAPADSMEGKTATNRQTGAKIVRKGRKWVPLAQ